MAADLNRDAVLAALKSVPGPDGKSNLVDLNLVSEVVLANRKVYFSILVPPARAATLEPMRLAAEAAVKKLAGVDQVSAVLTAERSAGAAPAAAKPAARPVGGGRANQIVVPGVKYIIAVASGKGGVGKSTTAVNLALGFQALGRKVGLLDADIYGPSVPRLLGLSGKPEIIEQKTIRPMSGYGLAVMSMGFLVAEGTPVIWRGPMVISALTQMLRDVAWGNLDVLVVDMPPGTGDVQITMAQQVPLAGAVIVSTPQDLALIDARKGLAMFQQVSVPVLGFVENMSYFLCPSCGTRSDIFGHGGARAEAAKLNVPFLGEIPLHMEIREKSDLGTPVVATAPDSPNALVYRDIAEKCWSALDGGKTGAKAAPRIVIE
jgi:ATP-binding protein involved in chromosome partitioning